MALPKIKEIKVGEFTATIGKAIHIKVDKDTLEWLRDNALAYVLVCDMEFENNYFDCDFGTIESYLDSVDDLEDEDKPSSDILELLEGIVKAGHFSVVQFFYDIE